MADIPAIAGRSAVHRLRRVGIRLILVTLLCYGGSNLWLSSRWVLGMAEERLKKRTGQDWRIDSMTWSPWNGFTLSSARILQPKALRKQLANPLVSVKTIRVKPYWGQLLRGRIRVREVRVDSPRVTMAVEMLATLVPNGAPSWQTPSPVTPPQKPQHPKDRKEASNPLPGNQKSPAGSPTQAKSKLQSPDLPLWLYIDGAGLRVVSVNKNTDLLKVEGVKLHTRVFGEDTGGVIRIATLRVPGFPQTSHLKQSIVWKHPYLQIENQTINTGGLKIRFMARLGLNRSTPGNLPFLVSFLLDPQKLEYVEWLEYLALEVNTECLAGKMIFSGVLNKPMSWRGNFLLAGEDVTLMEKHGNHDVVFDEVFIPVVFRQGALRWSGVRLIGEDASILGNGQISASGKVLAVTRLVVSTEIARMLVKSINGSHIVGTGMEWWSDLDTPDWKMRDILVSGSLANPMADVGNKKEELPLWQLVGSVVNFIREEMREESKKLNPIPNNGLLKTARHENH